MRKLLENVVWQIMDLSVRLTTAGKCADVRTLGDRVAKPGFLSQIGCSSELLDHLPS
jgi:hypothetical protein